MENLHVLNGPAVARENPPAKINHMNEYKNQEIGAMINHGLFWYALHRAQSSRWSSL